MIKSLGLCALGFVAMFAMGCSTSQKVNFSDTADRIQARNVHFVPKGGNSGDMDGHFRESLRARGLKVTLGPASEKPANSDLLISYDDTWRWDVVMYIQDMDVQVKDKAGGIVATARWENAPMHKYPDPRDVVDQVLKEIFSKIKVVK